MDNQLVKYIIINKLHNQLIHFFVHLQSSVSMICYHQHCAGSMKNIKSSLSYQGFHLGFVVVVLVAAVVFFGNLKWLIWILTLKEMSMNSEQS